MKSVVTALKDVFNNSQEFEYKLEFDLTACFNKIELEAVDSTLRSLNLPETFINYLR